jgi:hypothetical protein
LICNSCCFFLLFLWEVYTCSDHARSPVQLIVDTMFFLMFYDRCSGCIGNNFDRCLVGGSLSCTLKVIGGSNAMSSFKLVECRFAKHAIGMFCMDVSVVVSCICKGDGHINIR